MSRADDLLVADRKSEKKRLYLVTALTFAAAYTFCCFVISPLYTSLMNDISYSGGLLTELLRLINIAIELFAISVAYGVMVIGLYRFGASGYVGGFGIFLGATAYKYVANTIMSWSFFGRIPLEWAIDLLNVIFFVATEMLQLLLVALIVNKTVRASREKSKYLEREGIDREIDAERKISKIYDAENPLLRASLYCAIIIFASKMIGEVYNDLMYIISTGLPERISTVILMILNYLSCAVYGALCYAFILLTMVYLRRKKEKM